MRDVRPIIVDHEIDRLGSTITLYSVTDQSYSDWGDVTETTSSASVTAIVNTLSQEDQLVQEGTFKAGDKVFFMKSTQSVKRGDRIRHSGEDYEVDDILEHELEDVAYVKEVRASKV